MRGNKNPLTTMANGFRVFYLTKRNESKVWYLEICPRYLNFMRGEIVAVSTIWDYYIQKICLKYVEIIKEIEKILWKYEFYLSRSPISDWDKRSSGMRSDSDKNMSAPLTRITRQVSRMFDLNSVGKTPTSSGGEK